MKEITVGLTFLVTVLMTVEGYVSIAPLTKAVGELKNWGIILSAFAMGLAAFGLISLHVAKVRKRGKDQLYSAVLLAGFAGFLAMGLLAGPSSSLYAFYYRNILQSIGNAVFSLLMFYIVTAAYRSLSINKWQSAVILAAAAFVMLGSVPVGEALWNKIPVVSSWILKVPNTAGQRGILITSAIGGIAAAVRAALGLERSR